MQDRLLIWFNTRLVIGQCSLDDADGLLTVRTEHGSKTIRNGGLATKLLAKLIFVSWLRKAKPSNSDFLALNDRERMPLRCGRTAMLCYI